MNAKEKWIHETEKSLEGLKPVDVNPYLYSKILNRIHTKVEATPAKMVWATAAAFIILLLFNILVLKSTNKHSNSPDLYAAAKQYQLLNENNINYN